MAKNSTLEFKLHRLAYMQVIRFFFGTVFLLSYECRANDFFLFYRHLKSVFPPFPSTVNESHLYLMFQILSQGINAQTDALKYARTHFAKFVNIFQKEIQILMGALMYLPVGIENSPYRTLIAPEMWIEVIE